jgi:hypothetical protein
VQLSIHGQPRQAEAWNVVTGQAAFCNFRRPGIFDRGRAQAVEAENRFVVAIVNRKKGFRAAEVVALPGKTAQEFIQHVFAAIESAAIVFPADRLFVPCDHDYDRFGKARAAARSFALGLGGLSKRSRTRKLSRPDSFTSSASWITAFAASKAWRRTKSVRSVWSSATARTSSAFSSDRIRNCMRLLCATAILGMAAIV